MWSIAGRFAFALAILLPPIGAVAKDWTSIRIATEGAYPPFNEIDTSGQLKGFDIDIAKALCEKIGAKCSFVAQEWSGIIPGLLAGKYDAIVASMSITDERKKSVLFTVPYYSSPPVMIGSKASKIADWTPKGMKGKAIGAQASTTHATFLEDEYRPEGVEIRLYETQDEANDDLKAGRIDGVVAERIVLSEWMKKPDGACCEVKLAIDADKYRQIFGEGAGIAVRKGDADLAERLNDAIAVIVKDGTYRTINVKYFDFSIY